ncbi:MAG: cysteine peptidase family C39 domain-containing protein, partial [Ktedonobacteraceae bacterium]
GLAVSNTQLSAQALSTAFQPAPDTASSRIVRVNSADHNQYSTQPQYQVWSWSSCSGISLEEVMNSYGRHYIASDVLQVELNMGIWNTYDGLTAGEPGMARAAAYFGFKAASNPTRTLQDLIDVANSGTPVIVGIPGHIMVVKGGDTTNVYIVDSSMTNRTILTHAQFMNIWNKFSVLITPM